MIFRKACVQKKIPISKIIITFAVMEIINADTATPEELVEQIRRSVQQLRAMGRNDLLLHAIGASALEDLRVEAARGKLSRLVITADYHFRLVDYGYDVPLSPIHKAIYLLFLHHPEGIEFKRLSEFRSELSHYYKETANRMDVEKLEQTIDRLVNPFDNAINEKCSRIKEVFSNFMDPYSLCYYAISSHTQRHIAGSSRIWFERLKVITLPRELVVWGR